MTDKAVNLTASDAFALGGSFIPQTASVTTSQEHANMIKADGDWQKWSSVFNLISEVTVDYKFNAVAGLGAALPSIGEVSNGYMVSGISVSTVHNDWPTITITGHSHGENSHVAGMTTYSFTPAMIVYLTGALGAYDFFNKAAGAVCATDSTIDLSMDHIDAECDGGNHWVGTNVKGRLEATVNYIGEVATPATVAGWTVMNYVTPNDSNEDFDKSSITAELIRTRD